VARWSLTGKGFGEWEKRFTLSSKAVKDVRPTLNRVVYPWLRGHVQDQFESSGFAGGQPWDFSGEPLYERAKIRRFGKEYGTRPMLMPDDKAVLLPSLIDPSHPDSLWRLTPGQLRLGSTLEYADRLFNTGGVGPYGERYPARDPFVMTPAQKRELDRLIERDLARGLKRYIPLPGRLGSS
jgi:hypothetical protein